VHRAEAAPGRRGNEVVTTEGDVEDAGTIPAGAIPAGAATT